MKNPVDFVKDMLNNGYYEGKNNEPLFFLTTENFNGEYKPVNIYNESFIKTDKKLHFKSSGNNTEIWYQDSVIKIVKSELANNINPNKIDKSSSESLFNYIFGKKENGDILKVGSKKIDKQLESFDKDNARNGLYGCPGSYTNGMGAVYFDINKQRYYLKSGHIYESNYYTTYLTDNIYRGLFNDTPTLMVNFYPDFYHSYNTYNDGNNGFPVYGFFYNDEKDDVFLYINTIIKYSKDSKDYIIAENAHLQGYLSYKEIVNLPKRYETHKGMIHFHLNDGFKYSKYIDGEYATDKPSVITPPDKKTVTNTNPPKPPEGTTEYELDEDYRNYLNNNNNEFQRNFWKNITGQDLGTYSLKSHRSIIGLPFQFLPNVDARVGSSTYGKQYMEEIIYDMNIACIKPGGPVLNPTFDGVEYSDNITTKIAKMSGAMKGYWETLFSSQSSGDRFGNWLMLLMKGGYSRFYSFQQDYTYYIHYVNTLCHLFAIFLGIAEKKYRAPGSGNIKKYINYDDSVQDIETDKGLGMGHQLGFDNAVYVYYSPDSSLSSQFSNSTMDTSLTGIAGGASNAVKEWGFFMNAAGLEKANTGTDAGGVIVDVGEIVSKLPGGSWLGKLFSNAGEGITTVLSGNNLSLPQIYQDSDTTVHHDLTVKLVSPYGDPESVFIHVLVPLARLLAFSLPRQYGPNSYQSPFIIQAFSKGQFNCQLGIVSSLSIRRCGNGGESYSAMQIPTELEVTISIDDLYEKVFLSNEFYGNSAIKTMIGAGLDLLTVGKQNIGSGTASQLLNFGTTYKAAKMIFNNVGLLDFLASYTGFNLNMPTYMNAWTIIYSMIKNRTNEFVQYTENDGWKFPQWSKQLNDAYKNATQTVNTFVAL